MPTYDNSKTWSTEILTSTDMNNHIKNNFDALVAPPVDTWAGGNFTTTSNTYEDVTGASLSITLQEEGYIEVGVVGYFGGLPGDYIHIGLNFDGTDYDCTVMYDGNGNSNASFTYLFANVAPGTYTIKLRQKVTSGGSGEVRYKNFWAKGVV